LCMVADDSHRPHKLDPIRHVWTGR